MKKLIVALAFLVCGPAAAQWQVPANTIPYGRGPGVSGFNSVPNDGTGINCLLNTTPPSFGSCAILPSGALGLPIVGNGIGVPSTYRVLPANGGGTGVDNSAAAVNEVPAWTGSTFLHTSILAVINAVCTLTPKPCSYLFGYYSPQWFGAVCYGISTPLILMPFDSASAIQATVNQIAADSGGRLQFSACAYKIGTDINITGSNTAITGTGINQTQIIYAPASPGFAFKFSAGASEILNVLISNLSIMSADTTLTKIAIGFLDVSVAGVTNVIVASYPPGTGGWRGGGGGIGLNIAGRELGVVQNYQGYADQPIKISLDPNLGLAGALDSWTFNDFIGVAPLTGATTHVITLDNGVGFSNLRFTGHQNWIGGVDGFHWEDTSGTAISFGLHISGVKDEQAGAVGGYTVNINPNQTLYNFNFTNSTPAIRNAILLRKVFNTTLSGIFYDQSTSTTKIGLNADNSNTIIDFRGTVWPTGTLSSLGAFTTSGIVNPTGTIVALPASGVFYR